MTAEDPWDNYAKVIPHVDIVYHDIKVMDSAIHRKWSGAGNEKIHENLKRAYTEFPLTKFVARTPLIPGVKNSEENIPATVAFIRPHANVVNYELLPYHRFGQSNYGFLGRTYELADVQSPTPESLAHLRAIINEVFGRTETPATGYPVTTLEPHQTMTTHPSYPAGSVAITAGAALKSFVKSRNDLTSVIASKRATLK